jgi:hypothetical protein
LDGVDDRTRDLLVRGIAAAKANSRDDARRYLRLVLAVDQPAPVLIKAWQALADVSDDPAEKRQYLGQILALDPGDGTARRDLAILDGRLDPRDLIDPDRPPGGQVEPPRAGTRVACRRCGSPHVEYDASRHALVCASCHAVEPVESGTQNAGDRDFVAALWTARGHRAPVATPCFTCTACGASFIVAAGQLALTCPYCASVYTLDHLEPRTLVEPDGVVPFAVPIEAAEQAIADGLRDRGVAAAAGRPRAVFEPLWVLSFIGEVGWHGLSASQFGDRDAAEPVSGAYTILDREVRVPAVERMRARLGRVVDEFDLARAETYDPRLLAGWPASSYDLTLDRAALAGRPAAMHALRPVIADHLGPEVQRLSLDFSRMSIDAFRLVLVPIWLCDLHLGNDARQAIVSGQTGTVWTDLPEGRLARAFDAIASLFRRRDDA